VRIEREEPMQGRSLTLTLASTGDFELALVYARLAIFDSRVWCGIPSFAAAPRRPEPTLAFCQCSLDCFSFRSTNSLLSSVRAPEREPAPRELVRFARQPCLVYEERFFVAQNHGTLDDVL